MLTFFVVVAVSQAPLRAAVLDVSAPDAIYEDVSRELAQRVADELLGRGFSARRIDESELTIDDCRLGPCLGVIARAQNADVLVLVDASEGAKGRVDVALSAMRGRDGLPLAVGRWRTTAAGKNRKLLGKFIEATWRAAVKHLPPSP
ncbi:MAG: hypothetical protein INH41_13675 [Myxococcaceae bacterium]|jgi:hypothetical protein|nr:hypothetical protein [Myxococcaceae bacterium]MCA3013427.1 hypothetical protein [Myxococcaceae bacterium]